MSQHPIPNQAVGKLRYPTPTSTPTPKEKFKAVAHLALGYAALTGITCLALTGAYALVIGW
ncbi:MAG: hypothetical protein LKF82_07230 [Acinetobacter populi]|jgi:hypothetical protein|uniref:hypothetical protein n=1 Tax=Acinetobacter populi TaxID=1582270 RepID=UPI0023575D32|nr:hypothetical protein [Acinetobacter populi]MCH4247618.1 hypothetical protein [Acinetobacter populi]